MGKNKLEVIVSKETVSKKGKDVVLSFYNVIFHLNVKSGVPYTEMAEYPHDFEQLQTGVSNALAAYSGKLNSYKFKLKTKGLNHDEEKYLKGVLKEYASVARGK